MKTKYLFGPVFLVGFLIFCCASSYAENIDPNNDGNQYAWGENVGWVNFEPNRPEPNVGAIVTPDELSGFIWAENIGWINLDPNELDPNSGVTNDGAGNLSGYAWGENVGWINFDPNVPGDSSDYGVTIDSEGNFDGWAWGENIGWINFGLTDYHVVACKVTFVDLANFVQDWLVSGFVPANLDLTGNVDFIDYSIFASYWHEYCPDSWPLK